MRSGSGKYQIYVMFPLCSCWPPALSTDSSRVRLGLLSLATVALRVVCVDVVALLAIVVGDRPCRFRRRNGSGDCDDLGDW